MRNYVTRIVLVMLFFSFASTNSLLSDDGVRIPMIGETAPSFSAQTTQGDIKFPEDYWNKWVVLFCHPSDFTPVCSSELMRFAEYDEKFSDIGCELIGLSVDGINSHIQWVNEIEKIEFDDMKNIKVDYPIISDTHLEVSKMFGMIHPRASSTETVRGVFIIDDKQKIQAVMLYPMMTGRSIQEIYRLVSALQKVDNESVATPEGWTDGNDVFLTPLKDKTAAMNRFDEQTNSSSYYCPSWFMCIQPGTN